MLVCGVCNVILLIQVDAGVSLDPSVFPYTDVRNKGVVGGKLVPSQSRGRVVSWPICLPSL